MLDNDRHIMPRERESDPQFNIIMFLGLNPNWCEKFLWIQINTPTKYMGIRSTWVYLT